MTYSRAFTLVEIMIVVVILAIIAMIVVPQWGKASTDAKESQLACDISTVRKQIALYTEQHAGRAPHLDENGKVDTANFIARLTQKTDVLGKLGGGNFGPYLTEWPTNSFSDSSVAEKVSFGTNAAPPRDNTTGWYYSTSSATFSANSKTGGTSYDPASTSSGRTRV